MCGWPVLRLFFFFNDTATTEIYTLSLHDALPIFQRQRRDRARHRTAVHVSRDGDARSEEHTSELQSHHDLVCRLLLEKKKYYRDIGRIVLTAKDRKDNNSNADCY